MSFKIKSIVRLNRKNYIPLFAAGWFDLLYLLPTHIDSCTASSLQFHLFQPLDHPTSYCYICQFLVLKLPQWSRLCLVSAFICCTLLHKPLPPHPSTLLVVQSRPFTKHAGVTIAKLYIPHSICSWHSCITFDLLSLFPTAFYFCFFSFSTRLLSLVQQNILLYQWE